MRAIRTVAALLFFLLLASTASRAFGAELVKGEIVSVGIGGINGKDGVYRAGAWVPVRVRLENRSGKQLVCRLAVEQVDLDGDKVLSLGPQIILDAGDVNPRDSWLYYWHKPDDDDLHGVKSVVVLDDSGSQVLATLSTLTSLGGGGEARGINARDDTNNRSSRFVLLLGPNQVGFPSYNGSYGGTENVVSAWAQQSTDLPDHVLGLDGVDTIIWEADQLHASELPPDFQLKAILDWVRAGGHLIISVAAQGQDFLKSGDRLRDAMPMTFTGVRELKLDDIHTFPGAGNLSGDGSPIIQVTGAVRADARPTAAAAVPGSPLENHPLAVTGVYGQGAVTVLTVDITNPEMAQRLSEHDWIIFWNQIAGWQANHDSSKINDQIMTRAEYDEKRAQADLKKLDPPVYLPPAEVHIGDDIPRLVDVTETTRLDLLVAVLFLGVYWLAAGPIGHLVLRAYKVVHWSWWIFGATVVVAAGVASAIVMFLQLTNYDLRHKTIVLGTVNTRDVTVVGYYGVYAPVSGGISVSQPASGGGGLNYLAPMCMPTNESVKPFADPQSYQLRNENPHEAAPIFRNTLKKMQGRWSGVHEGIEGSATFVGGPESHFAGSLVNHSGYTLEHVEFLIHGPPTGKAQDQGISYLYAAVGGGGWKNGDTLDLAKGLQIEHYHDSSLPMRLEDVLQSLGRHFSQGGSIASSLTHGVAVVPAVHEDASLLEGRSDDLLYLLLDLRKPDPLADAERVEPMRPFARTTDCTKAFYAAGAMIIARAGNISSEHYVASPVPLTVNGRLVPGKGDILFAWALPIAGNVGAVPAMPDLNQLPANPKISAPIDPAQEPQ